MEVYDSYNNELTDENLMTYVSLKVAEKESVTERAELGQGEREGLSR